VPEAAVSNYSKTVALFDHLVGAGEQCRGSSSGAGTHRCGVAATDIDDANQIDQPQKTAPLNLAI
jgi:hypothetical protein